ncbi:MAG TPA: hypothetical protein VFP58_02405 [Candidatus Eisenbacteria bacterium]|nr:hypothetical protein [Candidatus Eisenbacteria bacterium]
MKLARAVSSCAEACVRLAGAIRGSACLLLIALVLLPTTGQAAPTWVNNLQPWQWYAIPGTALSTVDPTPEPPGFTGPSSKIVAWCGAGLKRQGSVYLIGTAGGHADYAGNEVDALALNTETPRWVQLRAPSATSSIINASQFYLDLKPSATHTYYATQFVNARNRLFVMPSLGMNAPQFLPAPPSGWAYPVDGGYTFSFNLATNDWDAPSYVPRYTGGGDVSACLVAKHPVTEDIYYSRPGGGWWKWTQATNTFARVNGNSPRNYCGAAIDPVRNRMLVVGSYSGTNGPLVLDLNGNAVSATFSGLGASSLTMAGYPGVVYDEASDRFLVVFNSGGQIRIRRVNPETWFVDEPSVTGSIPGSRQNGIQNAAQFVPELGGLVIANSYGGNVYFVRTSASLPAPDTSVPSTTSDLRIR